VISVIVSC